MANENTKDFEEEVMNNEEQNENTEDSNKKKLGLIEMLMALPLWKKALVVALLGGGVYFGARTIYKLVAKKPEAVAQAIELVTENPEVVVEAVEEATN